MDLNQGLVDLVAVALVAALTPLVVAALPGPRIPQVVIFLLGGVLIGPHVLGVADGEGEPARPSEVAVPVAVPDLGGVTPPHRHVPVAGQHFQVIDAELACHSGHDRLRYRGRVRLERADRPDGDGGRPTMERPVALRGWRPVSYRH